MRQSILAVTVLLLGVTTHISAQNRSPAEALKGLKDIGVVVKYGSGGGLSEEIRPNTLAVLHDRARALLREAGIPMLDSLDETEMAGRPRLVFTVTLNRENASAAAIHVDSRLYERVRLWRDSAKEIELATWVTGGVGYPKVTYEMLANVFEGQVKQFIHDYREVNPVHQQLKNGTPDPIATQVSNNSNSLQGLNGVRLFIWSGPTAAVDAPLQALLSTLQTEAEKKLKKAGIPVLRYANESESAGRPLLYVSIKMTPSHSPSPAIWIESEFWQRVRPIRDPKKDIYAVTWESQLSESGPVSDGVVVEAVNRQLEEFIKAYNAANPNVAAAVK
ncbi:MAG TPA: hypothetical protein VFR78_08330 [Pyrinomonadaceae bacterium]|nr:hypothetical protein [Pyrinomonadaceae bacterium]